MNSGTIIGDLGAERAVVGCLLLGDMPTVRDVLDRLSDDDLTDPRLVLIVKAVRQLVDFGIRPDPVTVEGQLRRTGASRSFTADRSCAVTIADTAAAPPSVGSATHYLTIVIEHAWRRQVEVAGIRLQQVAGTTSLDVLQAVPIEELRALVLLAARWTAPSPGLGSVGGAT